MVACLWWVYFDGHEDLRVEGTTAAMVVYSYAHLPLLIGLAAVSGGISLLIDEAREDHLAAGAAVALAGGAALYLLALIAAHSAIQRPAWAAVVRARLVAAAGCGALVPAALVLPPVATVAILLTLLAALVAGEGILVRSEASWAAAAPNQVRASTQSDG